MKSKTEQLLNYLVNCVNKMYIFFVAFLNKKQMRLIRFSTQNP